MISGVMPVPMSTASSASTGRKSWYRHMESGPFSILFLLTLLAMES